MSSSNSFSALIPLSPIDPRTFHPAAPGPPVSTLAPLELVRILCGVGIISLAVMDRMADNWAGGVESDTESGCDVAVGNEGKFWFVGVAEFEIGEIHVGHTGREGGWEEGGSGSLAGGVHPGVGNKAVALLSFVTLPERSASHTLCPNAITAFSIASSA